VAMDPEKKPTTFGVTIEQPSTPSQPGLDSQHPTPLHLRASKETVDSSPLSAMSTHSHGIREPGNPFSAFYEHRPSTSGSNNLKAPPVYYHDIESQGHLSTTKSTISRTQECTMWPSHTTLKAKALQEKKKKSWNPLIRLNKRQKLTAQILIALLIIGAAVGIGVGVSRAVGGGVWSSQGQTKQIP
ncbi:hypothetical protein EJ08DRAFT_572647, partial [Tothia fuscella]